MKSSIPFLIENQTGTVSIEDRTFGPDLRLERLKDSSIGPNIRPLVANPPWRSFGHVFNSGISIVWTFKDDVLRIIRLAISRKPDCDDVIPNEERRQTIHNKILFDLLGMPPYVFVWDEVTSGIDYKTGDAGIAISYN